MSKFKVGDKVKLKHNCYSNYHMGDEGVACLYEKAHNHGIIVRMNKPLSDNQYEWFFTDNELELVENVNQKIEVGDIVKIKSSSKYYGDGISNPANTEGVVVLKYSGGSFNVKWNNGEDDNYPPDHLELVSKANKGEVVGYELLKDLPGIPAGTKSDNYTSTKKFYTFQNGDALLNFSHINGQLKDTTWFKPIYKTKEVVVKISKGREVTLKDNKVHLGSQGFFTFKNVLAFKETLDQTETIDGFKVSIKDVTYQIGCQEFTKSDLLLVIQAIQNLK